MARTVEVTSEGVTVTILTGEDAVTAAVAGGAKPGFTVVRQEDLLKLNTPSEIKRTKE